MVSVLTGVAIAVFVLFFLLKDGGGMGDRVVGLAPGRHRERVADIGRQAWDTRSRYVRGVARPSAAVLVAPVIRGPVIALVVLGIVLVVQNVEGNIPQPFVQSRAVRLHPVIILVAVTVGTLLFGVGGAVAVVRRVATALRDSSAPVSGTSRPGAEGDDAPRVPGDAAEAPTAPGASRG